MSAPSATTIDMDPALVTAAQVSKAWPFEEAKKLINRLKKQRGEPGTITFETGYGPSGLPHIGTFGEVARTTMVQHAFRVLTEDKISTELICFSDDMDGFRKVPTNVPNQDMLAGFLNMPLTKVPDPFTNQYESFAHHNNARLRHFLDQFGFDYTFLSSTEVYKSGRFDATLLKMLSVYDDVMKIMLPTLGEERRKTYSPFLPICPRTGKVLQVPVEECRVADGTIVYVDPETSAKVEVPVTGGQVKCQWKADWAMRWAALGVDYEMAGKDLSDSVKQSGRICRALGATPPEGFSYELFLDEKGEKISKSKGNGLSIEDWLKYASPESLALFMFQKPKTAKKLYFDVIPKTVDEYYTFLAKFPEQPVDQQLTNPVWHMHTGTPPQETPPVGFSMLMNLVSASNAQDPAVLWGFISRYAADATPETHPELDRMVGYAIRYFEDFVKPQKVFRAANALEEAAMRDLDQRLQALPVDQHTDGEAIQSVVYDVGKTNEFENLRDWFKALYQVLLGQDQGPRFGSFIALYGVEETRTLIAKGLSGAFRKS